MTINITAKYNPNYGTPLITSKYSPLMDIQITNIDGDSVSKIFNGRINPLSIINKIPSHLCLWIRPEVYATLNNLSKHPVVVISTKRAEFISSKLQEAENDRVYAPKEYCDLSSNSKVCLWYSPKRSQRPVFIVVYYLEYPYYLKKIEQLGLKNTFIIGWKFGQPTEKNIGMEVVGFGPSRFVAIEIVKFFNCQKAWLVDDNVVNINGFPSSLEKIEDLMNDQIYGIGFNAATKSDSIGDLQKTIEYSNKLGQSARETNLLLQQVVLWNINLLKQKNINFSPYFIASNEDVSFSNFLHRNNYQTLKYSGLSIKKMNTDEDKENQDTLSVITQKREELIFYLMTFLYNSNPELKSIFQIIRENLSNSTERLLLAEFLAVEQILAKLIYPNVSSHSIPPPETVFDDQQYQRDGNYPITLRIPGMEIIQ